MLGTTSGMMLEAGNGVLDATEKVLETVAIGGGLGWSGSIIATTLLLRSALTLPLVVKQLKTAATLELEAKPEVDAWRERIKGEIFRDMRDRGVRSYRGLSPAAAAAGTTAATENASGGAAAAASGTGEGAGAGGKERDGEVEVEAFQKEFETRVKSKALEVYREHGYRPVQSLLLPLAQIPLWITLSLTIRRMAATPLPFLETHTAPLPGLSEAGYLWFTDLTLPDPTWVFPLIIGSSYLLNVEVTPHFLSFRRMTRQFLFPWTAGASLKKNRVDPIPGGLHQRHPSGVCPDDFHCQTGSNGTQTTHRHSPIVIIYSLPLPLQQQALTLYWATSATYSLAQNIAFKFPQVKRAFGVRQTPSEKQTPLFLLVDSFRKRLTSGGIK